MKLQINPRGNSCSATAGLTFAAPKLRRCPPMKHRIADLHSPHLWARCVRVEMRRQVALSVRPGRREAASGLTGIASDPSVN